MNRYRLEYRLVFGNGTKSGINVNHIDAESAEKAELLATEQNRHECVEKLDFLEVAIEN